MKFIINILEGMHPILIVTKSDTMNNETDIRKIFDSDKLIKIRKTFCENVFLFFNLVFYLIINSNEKN